MPLQWLFCLLCLAVRGHMALPIPSSFQGSTVILCSTHPSGFSVWVILIVPLKEKTRIFSAWVFSQTYFWMFAMFWCVHFFVEPHTTTQHEHAIAAFLWTAADTRHVIVANVTETISHSCTTSCKRSVSVSRFPNKDTAESRSEPSSHVSMCPS